MLKLISDGYPIVGVPTERFKDILIVLTDRQTGRRADGQMGRWADGQTYD
jgi:hypothetical protein